MTSGSGPAPPPKPTPPPTGILLCLYTCIHNLLLHDVANVCLLYFIFRFVQKPIGILIGVEPRHVQMMDSSQDG